MYASGDDLTPAEIAFVKDLFKKTNADQLLQPKEKLVKIRDHHSVPEIRLLILTHINAIKEEIGDCEFNLNVFRFVLKKHIKMRSKDKEVMEGYKQERFDHQLLNAIRPLGWADGCPIESTGNRGIYRFTKSNQPSLFTQAQ